MSLNNFFNKKVIILSIKALLIVLIYDVLKSIRNAIFIHKYGSSEMIPVIKVVSTPIIMGIIFLFYSKIAVIFKRTTNYYIMISIFISFYIIFSFFIYPNIDLFILKLPIYHYSLKYLIWMINYWPIVLYYSFSEVWIFSIFAIIFWQLVNQVVKIDEVKKTYPIIIVFAFIGAFIGSFFVFSVGKIFQDITLTLKMTSIYITAICIILIMLMIFLQKIIGSDIINGTTLTKIIDQDNNIKLIKPKKTIEMTWVQSIKQVFTSGYIFAIMVMIFCLAVCTSIVDQIWYKFIEISTSDSKDFVIYQSFIQSISSLFSIILALFSIWLFKIVSWKNIMISIPILKFFVVFCMFFPTVFPIFLLLNIGSIQFIVIKSFEIVLFKTCKEMCFIPLDENLKSVGKAAADSIGSAGGRCFGSILFLIPLSFINNSNLLDIIPYYFFIFIFFIIIWVISALYVNKKFQLINKIYNYNKIKISKT